MASKSLQILRSLVLGNRPTGRLYGEPYVNFAENQFGVINNSNVAQDLIGVPFFSAAATYSIGNVVNHLGKLYSAVGSVPAGAWNSAQWNQITGAGAVTLFTTGDVKLTFKTTADAGWIMMNDGSIGDASSGATYANVNTQNLFNLFYANCADADVPLQTSTGTATTRSAQGTAAAAWTAHCRMVLPKALGRMLAVSGAGAGLTSRSLGSATGAETHTQSAGEVVAHAHNSTGGGGDPFALTAGGTVAVPNPGNQTYVVNTYAYNTATAGSSSPMAIMNPAMNLNVMVCL
jgi:hypothetical protein